jgi:hypothetical protein
MFIIKKLDYQDRSKIKEFIELHNSIGDQSLSDIKKNDFNILNFEKIDNIIQRYVPQDFDHLINDRQATAIYDSDGSIIAISLSRKFSIYPTWALSMIISNPTKSPKTISRSIEHLVKWVIEQYEAEHLYDFWCTIPLKKYQTYNRFHKYFPGRYSLTLEAVCEKGARPKYELYWTLVGGTLPESDTALIRWSLKSEYRKTETFNNLYASI